MSNVQSAPASRPAQAARRILTALESADVGRLEGELHLVSEARRRGLPADQFEQLELLEAIAEGLAGALRRPGAALSAEAAGGGAEVRLLRHLAGLHG